MYTPILGVLGYVLHPDGERVLLVHRSRDGDQHQGKYNGLGGKVENDEDVVSALCRELRARSADLRFLEEAQQRLNPVRRDHLNVVVQEH